MEDLTAAHRIAVTEPSQVAEARRSGIMLGHRLGFDETRTGQLAIAITEAGTNLVKHARGGEILLCPLQRSGGTELYLLAIDKGPGMGNIAQCLEDGYSTAGSPGTGLGAISRLASSLEFYSQAGAGTVLCACFAPPAEPTPRPVHWAGFSIPVAGETVCGDSWAASDTTSGLRVMVADGLGHGPVAHEAARAAVTLLRESPDETPAELLASAHKALRSTRGAAVAIADLNATEGRLRFCGAGNIAGACVTPTGAQHFVSMNGTAGHQMMKPREFTYALPGGALVILHSDGLGTRWDVKAYPGLILKPLMVIAAVLYRDFTRGRDDVTVWAARVQE